MNEFTLNPRIYRFDPTPRSKWKACSCENLDGEGNIRVKCDRQPWTTIPTIPYENRSLFSHNVRLIPKIFNFIAPERDKNQSGNE